jgi:hypothetical protein
MPDPTPANLLWPKLDDARGPGYWLRPGNLLAGRRRLRTDHSNEWRYEFLRTSSQPAPPPGCDPDPEARSRSYTWLMGKPIPAGGFRCAILGDTGEGDHSQIGLLPILRHLKVDFLIINGDVAYPAGRNEDYEQGFFQPYAGLGLPVWTVPGNHDYYSDNRGREYFEVFCTELRRARWDAARLVLRPQPGSYWELAEPAAKLVILGVDSGHSADLDGRRGGGLLGLFGERQPPDTRQHEWLAWRLELAERAGASVILLFHIPALVDEKQVDKVYLGNLHQVIAQFSCVRLVLTAHTHNYQRYTPTVFAQYLSKVHGATPGGTAPTYLVSGAGGAYINATDFDNGSKTGFTAVSRYPTAADWKQWAPLGLRIVAGKLGHGVLNQAGIGVLKLFTKLAEQSDADRPERLSLLLLTHVPPNQTTVQPYFIDDLAQMYGHLPAGTPIQVQEGDPDLDPASMGGCCRDETITF